MKVLHSNPSRLKRCLMTGGVLFVIWAHHAPARERAILTTVATHTIVSGSANTAELGDVVTRTHAFAAPPPPFLQFHHPRKKCRLAQNVSVLKAFPCQEGR